eukprot:gene3149-3938_t
MNLYQNVVVWFDWEEWKTIYKYLYSDNKEKQNYALKRVSAWKSRGNLPISIEVTSYFIELLNNSKNRSENEIELGLSMAICRMVNGFIDSTQNAFNRRNMFFRAEMLNLPKMFVDIRHEASHGRLPSIHLLKLICGSALNWVDDTYWRPQMSMFGHGFTETMKLLTDYRDAFRQTDVGDPIKYNLWIKNHLKVTVTSICQVMNNEYLQGSVLIPILLDYEFIVPDSRKGLVFEEIPQKFIKLWNPLLLALHKELPHFLILMLTLLTDRVLSFNNDNKVGEEEYQVNNNNNNTDSNNKEKKILSESQISLMSLWIIHFLKNYNYESIKYSLDMIQLESPQKSMMAKFLMNYNEYSSKIAQFMMSSTSDFNSVTTKQQDDEYSSIYQQRLMQQQVLQQQKKITITWKLIPNDTTTKWNLIPVGVSPNLTTTTYSSASASSIEKGIFDLSEDLDNGEGGSFLVASDKEYTTKDYHIDDILFSLNQQFPSLKNDSILKQPSLKSSSSSSKSLTPNNNNNHNIPSSNSENQQQQQQQQKKQPISTIIVNDDSEEISTNNNVNQVINNISTSTTTTNNANKKRINRDKIVTKDLKDNNSEDNISNSTTKNKKDSEIKETIDNKNNSTSTKGHINKKQKLANNNIDNNNSSSEVPVVDETESSSSIMTTMNNHGDNNNNNNNKKEHELQSIKKKSSTTKVPPAKKVNKVGNALDNFMFWK